MNDRKFNIRVYGVLIQNGHVLVTDEWLGNAGYTKFPGGGLEWGEGIEDCLVREFREEMNIETEAAALYYINGFFQPSVYHPNHQVISIYYLVNSGETDKIPITTEVHAFVRKEHGEQLFRWVPIHTLKTADFHFPIDKKVVEKLLGENPE